VLGSPTLLKTSCAAHEIPAHGLMLQRLIPPAIQNLLDRVPQPSGAEGIDLRAAWRAGSVGSCVRSNSPTVTFCARAALQSDRFGIFGWTDSSRLPPARNHSNRGR
jgi:hypothetical protein